MLLLLIVLEVVTARARLNELSHSLNRLSQTVENNQSGLCLGAAILFSSVWEMAAQNSRHSELASVLVRLDHIARFVGMGAARGDIV